MRARDDFLPWPQLEPKLQALALALGTNDVGVVRQMLQQLVAGYTPTDDIVDWVYLEQLTEANGA